MILIYFIFCTLFAIEDGKALSYNKSPKSLFLIKKAKVESDVGEPILLLFDRQKRTILNDERFQLDDN
jgi:hypothetical protein